MKWHHLSLVDDYWSTPPVPDLCRHSRGPSGWVVGPGKAGNFEDLTQSFPATASSGAAKVQIKVGRACGSELYSGVREVLEIPDILVSISCLSRFRIQRNYGKLNLF